MKLLILQTLDPGFIGSTGEKFEMLARQNEAIEFQVADVFTDGPDLTLNRPLEFLVLLYCYPRM